MGTHLRATERHLSYEMTQSYLPRDTGEREPPWPQPIPEGQKAEFTLVGGLYIETVYQSTVTHPSSNHLTVIGRGGQPVHCKSNYATKPQRRAYC